MLLCTQLDCGVLPSSEVSPKCLQGGGCTVDGMILRFGAIL